MRTAINVDKSSLAENECIRNLIYAVLGGPVFLTKNGRGKYVVLDIEDYERDRAEKKLLMKLKGRRSGAGRGRLAQFR